MVSVVASATWTWAPRCVIPVRARAIAICSVNSGGCPWLAGTSASVRHCRVRIDSQKRWKSGLRQGCFSDGGEEPPVGGSNGRSIDSIAKHDNTFRRVSHQYSPCAVFLPYHRTKRARPRARSANGSSAAGSECPTRVAECRPNCFRLQGGASEHKLLCQADLT